MGIFLWDTAPSKIFIGSSEVASVWAWDTKVRPTWYPTESIVYKMNADSSWNLYVPLSWRKPGWWVGNAYSWKVSVDGWAETTYSWTWSNGGSITISWYTSWSEHIITIKPTTETYWWALAYWWTITSGRTYITEILYDGSYMGYATSATDTWNNFRYQQYNGCTNLKNAAEENIPDTVTTIWNSFRASQYNWCSSLVTIYDENIGSSVKTIWANFRSNQYASCTSLQSPAKEWLPNTVTSIWNQFRSNQYSSCTSLTFASEEAMPTSITTIWQQFRASQYYWCTALTQIKWWKDLNIGNSYYRYQQFNSTTSNKVVTVMTAVWYAAYDAYVLPNSYVTQVRVPSSYLSSFKSTWNQPRSSITDSKFVWY